MPSHSGAPAPPARRSARIGVRVALFGAALQVVGFGWDAFMHHRDPSLAAKEGIFTLGNPSHLLISLGLLCCAIGSVVGVLGSTVKIRAQRPRLVSLLTLLTVLTFSLATAGVALATARSQGHDHGAHPHKNAAGAVGSSSHHGSEEADDPLLAHLVEVMQERGTAAALAELEAAVAAQPAVLDRSHHIVHELGRRSFAQYGSSRDAFANCTAVYEWGCYHGVLEAYLDAQDVVDEASIQNACTSTVDTANVNVMFQCLHGLGHGLVLHLDGQVSDALPLCDNLADEWQRVSCYTGAFMENLVEGQAVAATGEPLESTGLMLRSDDPLYPCNELEQRYLSACYEMQSSVILWFNQHDFAAAGETCRSLERRYAAICMQGLGREAFGSFLDDPVQGVPSCAATAKGALARFCYIGLAKNVINADSTAERSMEVCSASPRRFRNACFGGVGEAIAPVLSDPAALAAECDKAPREYRATCSERAMAQMAPEE